MLLLLLSACAPLGDFEDEPVASATLYDLDTTSAMVIGGYVGGDAMLVYTTPDGDSGAVPVSVQGGAIGAVVAVTADLAPNSDVSLDLSEADGDLTVRDLMGTYRGTGWNLTVGLGGNGHQLRNGAGVRLSDEHFTAGVGVEAGFEWLRIREGGNESIEDDEWSWPEDTGPFEDTDVDDTDDTDANPDTGPGPTPIDTGDGGAGGCNGGSSEPIDTGDDGGGSASCSGGCDGGDACGCASVSIGGAPWWWALAVTFARRRRDRGAGLRAGVPSAPSAAAR